MSTSASPVSQALTVPASKVYPRKRRGTHPRTDLPTGGKYQVGRGHYFTFILLPFSNRSSCGSQWSFLRVKKIQSTTHPTAMNVSFVQVLREIQKSRQATGHCILINTSAAYNLACRTAMCFTIESFLGQPAAPLKTTPKMSPASSTKNKE